MDFKHHKIPTSEFLHNAVRAKNKDRITIDELKISLHERGFGIMLIIFTLPVSIPMPYIPGSTTILSIPLFFLTLQMVLGYEFPWLPKWLSKKSVKREFLTKIILKSSPILKKIESVLRPRYLAFSGHTASRIIGLLSFAFSLSIALPLPFTNFVPGVGILVMSFGLLSRDGLVVILGAIMGLCGLTFTVAMILFGKKLVMGIIHSIF
jgi:hypothetical protein